MDETFIEHKRRQGERDARRKAAFDANFDASGGTMEAREPSLRDDLAGLFAKGLSAIGAPGGERGAYQYAKNSVMPLAEMSPLGAVTAAGDLAQADTGEARQEAILGMLSPPGMRGEIGAGREALSGLIGKGTRGMAADAPLAHGRIAQRFPTSPKASEDPYTQNLLINMDVLKSDPDKAKQASDIVGTYPGFDSPAMQEMAPNERLDAARDQMRDNLLYLHDQMPPEQRARSSNWYLGANKISGERAAEVGIPHESAAAAYAAQSPQKDWYQNVYLGDQVLRGLHADPKLTPDMMRLAETLPAYKPELMDQLRGVEGRQLSEMNPTEAALSLRLWDQTQGPRQYAKISPEGGYGDLVTTGAGNPAKPAWGTFGDIEKAVTAARGGGDMNQISDLMGGKHKVRNFYNNIIAPVEGRPFGDITADTHQIAASLFRPLSGSSPEVLQGLQSGSGGVASPPVSAMTGMRGLYPLYADATRQAAAARDIPVHAMQSIPWEGIRSLYPAEFKTPKNQMAIDDIWKLFGKGDISADEARQRSVARAGGYRPPSW